MPRYDYQCDRCDHRTELRHGFDEDASGSACPQCPGHLARVIAMPVVHYKGYGFYATDTRSGDEKYAFDHFDGSGRNPELKTMERRIKDPGSTVPQDIQFQRRKG